MTISSDHPSDAAIICETGTRSHNRPLYGANLPSVVLSGDRPCLRLAYGQAVCGDFMLAYQRGEQIGTNIRAVVVSCSLRPNLELVRVSLECLSEEVVVGLLGLTVVV